MKFSSTSRQSPVAVCLQSHSVTEDPGVCLHWWVWVRCASPHPQCPAQRDAQITAHAALVHLGGHPQSRRTERSALSQQKPMTSRRQLLTPYPPACSRLTLIKQTVGKKTQQTTRNESVCKDSAACEAHKPFLLPRTNPCTNSTKRRFCCDQFQHPLGHV